MSKFEHLATSPVVLRNLGMVNGGAKCTALTAAALVFDEDPTTFVAIEDIGDLAAGFGVFDRVDRGSLRLANLFGGMETIFESNTDSRVDGKPRISIRPRMSEQGDDVLPFRAVAGWAGAFLKLSDSFGADVRQVLGGGGPTDETKTSPFTTRIGILDASLDRESISSGAAMTELSGEEFPDYREVYRAHLVKLVESRVMVKVPGSRTEFRFNTSALSDDLNGRAFTSNVLSVIARYAYKEPDSDQIQADIMAGQQILNSPGIGLLVERSVEATGHLGKQRRSPSS